MIDGGALAPVEKPEFYWVIGNMKTAIRTTYHWIDAKYAQRNLAEFEYRFNRRYSLPDWISRLIWVALRTSPMPEKC